MAIADDLNEQIDLVVDEFSRNMQSRGNAAWRKVARNLRNMTVVKDVTAQGNYDPGEGLRLIMSDFNSETIADVGFELTATTQTPAFTNSVQRMKNSLEPMRDMVRDYYEDKFDLTFPYEALRETQGLVESTKNFIDTEISDAGFNLNVVNPAMSALSFHLANGSDRREMIGDMEHRIQDRIRTFTDIKAATIMQIFGRELNDRFGRIVSNVAEYAGPVDNLNRDFCAVRVGRKFTSEQIKEWPLNETNPDGSPGWDGMIAGTNSTTIFTNLGGWNCRHILEWQLPDT